MLPARNHEPLRWRDQSDAAKAVWNYFNDILTPQLVRSALLKSNCTLSDLYYALAKLRAKCEWVKLQVDKPDFDIKRYAEQETAGDIDMRFGVTVGSGVSHEPNVLSQGIWGKKVVELVIERMGNDYGGVGLGQKKIALSTQMINGKLIHQPRMVLDKTEIYFQHLKSTDNTLDFFIWSAHVVYKLANHVTVVRGNAAVCEQLIDNIFHDKFGRYFSAVINIRSELQDWVAFFETQEDYVNFYVITAVTNILKAFSSLPEFAKAYLEQIPDWLLLNPYREKNQAVRKEIWRMLKEFINILSNHKSTTANEKWQLTNLCHSDLIFRKPFTHLQKIISLADKNGRYDVEELTKVVIAMSAEDRAYMKRIIDFEYEVEAAHFKSIGMHVGHEDRQLWFDLETLRCFSFKTLNAYAVIDKALVLMGLKRDKHVQVEFDCYVYPYPDVYSIPRWVRSGWLTPDDVFAITPHVVEQLNSNPRVNMAVFSGGLRVQDMAKLTVEQLTILCSPCALYLYNAARFITARDLMAESVHAIEHKIITLMTEVSRDQTLPYAVVKQLNEIQLAQMFGDRVLIDDISLSQSGQRNGLFARMVRKFKGDEQAIPTRPSPKSSH